ncbi:MAG: DUF1028 domain-containing protein, partial [Polyangiaceae bacterium]
PDTGPHASHRSGEVGGVTNAIQGNILTGVEVLERMEVAFVEGCDLPERLMRALEAGGVNGEGDSRCTPDLPADSGFMRVETAKGTRVLDFDHLGTSPDDPVGLLRADYDAWQAEHPCPELGGTGGATSEGSVGGDPTPAPNHDAARDEDGCTLRSFRTLRAGPTTMLAALAALAGRRRR